MAFVLSKPGDVSDWIALSDYARSMADASEDVKAHWLRIAEMVQDLRVKVRVLSDRQYKQFCSDQAALADADDALVQSSDKDLDVCRAGLAAVDGVEPPQPEITDDVLQALAASGVHALISSAILKHHTLPPSERAAFFTWAQAG